MANTVTLKTILDDRWFASVEQAIERRSDQDGPADPAGILYDFYHPLRGVEWFERDQELAFADRRAEIDEDGRFAIWLTGLDPLRTMLPKIDERLSAFARLPFKRNVVADRQSAHIALQECFAAPDFAALPVSCYPTRTGSTRPHGIQAKSRTQS